MDRPAFHTDNVYTEDQLHADLFTLHKLNIINYKIRNEIEFEVRFSDEFLDYTRRNEDKIKSHARENLNYAVRKFPKELGINEETIVTTYYVTTVYDWLEDTKRDKMIDLENFELIARLAYKIREIDGFMYINRIKRHNGGDTGLN